MNEKKAEIILDSQHRDQLQGFSRQHKTGVLTLVFTDMVGSTKIKQELGDEKGVAIIRNQQAEVRALLESFPDSQEISTAGDSFFIAFLRPSDAVRFSLLLHARLRDREDAIGFPVQVRIGIHMGEVFIEQGATADTTNDLYGLQVDTTARIQGLAGGGQTLVTLTVFDNARSVLRGKGIDGMGQLSWLDHGPYKVKGVEDPIRICEVGEEGIAPLKAPEKSDKAFRYISEDQEPVLGWRPALDEPLPGSQWVLEEKLGEGGFGEVWRARHTKLNDHRVFKFCFKADKVRSLKREVTLFKVLKEKIGEHPRIVRIYDVYFEKPPYYIAMESVKGKNLEQWCESAGGILAVPLETRLEIVSQVAEALQAAHDAGIIHRDIKPSNILISGSNTEPGTIQVKLTDFGIGQVTSRDVVAGITAAGVTEMVVGSTGAGTSGTQMYMAPELTAGMTASPASDIYSLGVVLFQLLVGSFARPVTTDWRSEILDELLADDLFQCFSGTPEQRFGGAGELEQRLRSLRERRAEKQIHQRKKTAVIVGLVSAVFCVIIAGFWLAFRQEAKLRKNAERETYLANIVMASQHLKENRYREVRQLLAACKPEFRNWEWGYLTAMCNRDRMTLRPHREGLTSVAISNTEPVIVTGSIDSTVVISDSRTGNVLKRIPAGSSISTMVLSPDGSAVLTGCADGNLALWNTAGGTLIWNVREPSDIVSAGFSPDGSSVVACPWSSSVRLRRTADGSLIREFKPAGGHFREAVFTPGGNGLVCSGAHVIRYTLTGTEKWRTVNPDPAPWKLLPVRNDGLVAVALNKVYRVRRTGAEMLYSGSENITAGGISSDGSFAAVGFLDGTVRVFRTATGEPVATLEGHEEAVSGIAFMGNDGRMATSSQDRTVKIWDALSDPAVRKITGHTGAISSLDFCSNGSVLVSAGWDNAAVSWEMPAGKRLHTYKRPLTYLKSVSTAARKPLAAIGTSDRNVTLWDPATGTVRHRIAVETREPVVCLDPAGSSVWMSMNETLVSVRDAASASETARFSLPPGLTALYRSADSDKLGCIHGASRDSSSIRHPENGILIRRLGGLPALSQEDVAWSFNWFRNLAALASARRYVLVDLTNGALTDGPDVSGIKSLCLVTGRALCGTHNRLRLFDRISGRELLSFDLHDGPITALAWSPEMHILATGGKDKAISLVRIYPWDEKEYLQSGAGDLQAGIEMYKRSLTAAKD